MSLTNSFLRLAADGGFLVYSCGFPAGPFLCRRSVCLAFARQSPGAEDQGLLEGVHGLCGGDWGRHWRKVFVGSTLEVGILVSVLAIRRI